MNRLDRARDIVRSHPVPPALRDFGKADVGRYAHEGASFAYYDGTGTQFHVGDVTADVLAASLCYVVNLDPVDVAGEAAVPLGASKYNGLPHLPPGVTWPAGQYFVAQLDLAEFHPYDVYDVFPDHGLISIFLSMSSDDVTVMHHGGPSDELRVTPYPDASTFPDAEYYLSDFRDETARLRFKPQAVFYLGGDAYDRSELRNLLPKELLEQVGSALGAPVASRSGGFNMFGRPLYWQGEDEDGGEAIEILVGDDGEPILDDDGEYIVLDRDADDDDDERPPTRPHGPKVMLFQDEIGDASVHVWISLEDARKRDYRTCWTDSSCT